VLKTRSLNFPPLARPTFDPPMDLCRSGRETAIAHESIDPLTEENQTVVLELSEMKKMLRIEFQMQEVRFRSMLQEHLTGLSIDCRSEEIDQFEASATNEPKPLSVFAGDEVSKEDGLQPVEEEPQKEQDAGRPSRGSGIKLNKKSGILKSKPSLMRELEASRLGRLWKMFGEEQEVDDTKCLNRFVCSKYFVNVSTLIVVLNAVQLGYSSEFAITHLSEPRTMFIDIVDIFFCVFYGVELVLKLAVFRLPFFYNHEWKWNWFDTFLVCLAVYEETSKAFADQAVGGNTAAIVRMIRLVKTVKMLRFIHAMNFFRELRHFLVPITQSVRSLFWTMLMLSIILYIFAIVFLQGVADAFLDDEVVGKQAEDLMIHFGSVKDAMTSLYMAITGGDDWSKYADLLKGVGLTYYYFFFFYIAFLTFAVLNILTGIFVDSAMQYSSEDRSSSREDVEADEKFKSQVLKELASFDDDKEGELSMEEFERHLQSPMMADFLDRLSITEDDALTLLKRLTLGSPEGVDLETFLDCAIFMKGTARSVHLHELMAESQAAKLEILAVLRGLEEKIAKPVRRLPPKAKSPEKINPHFSEI